MVTISNGKVIVHCPKCGKYVQANKPGLGSLHFCKTDCQLAGRHTCRIEERGFWVFKTRWYVCVKCGAEQRLDD